MIDQTTIYWITRLDSLKSCLFGMNTLAIVALFASCLALVAYLVEYGDGTGTYYSTPTDTERAFWRKVRTNATRGIVGSVLSIMAISTVMALTPTTKEMAAILAIPAVANNEDVQEIGTDIVELAKSWLQEMKPEEK